MHGGMLMGSTVWGLQGTCILRCSTSNAVGVFGRGQLAWSESSAGALDHHHLWQNNEVENVPLGKQDGSQGRVRASLSDLFAQMPLSHLHPLPGKRKPNASFRSYC